jgi:hypothetical protein
LKMILVVGVLLGTSLLYGSFLFHRANGFQKPTNVYKVPDSAIAASRLPNGSRLLADQLTAAYVRSVNGHIQVAFSRETYMQYDLHNNRENLNDITELFMVIDGTARAPANFTDRLLAHNINYIIYSSHPAGLDEYVAREKRFVRVTTTPAYSIYKLCPVQCGGANKIIQ